MNNAENAFESITEDFLQLSAVDVKKEKIFFYLSSNVPRANNNTVTRNLRTTWICNYR